MISERSRTPRAGLLGAFALAALVVTAGPAGAADEFGTIKGRLVWGGDKAPESAPLVKKDGDKDKKDHDVCTAKGDVPNRELVVDPKTKGVANSFAYLVKPKGKNPAAEKDLVNKEGKVEVDQKGCEFIPDSTALIKGQKVVFKSSDPVGYNVRYQGFSIAPCNVALPPNGQVEVPLNADTRPISLNCDIHPWMTGKIMVFDHPFFAVTKEDGSFEITGVPAGDQAIVVWQEKVGFVTPNKAKGQTVKVEAGKTVDIGDVKLDPKAVK